MKIFLLLLLITYLKNMNGHRWNESLNNIPSYTWLTNNNSLYKEGYYGDLNNNSTSYKPLNNNNDYSYRPLNNNNNNTSYKPLNNNNNYT